MTDKILRFKKPVNINTLMDELSTLMPPRKSQNIRIDGQLVNEAIFTVETKPDNEIVIIVPENVTEEDVQTIINNHDSTKQSPVVKSRLEVIIDDLKAARNINEVREATIAALEVLNGSRS
jgi:hypothetical protein